MIRQYDIMLGILECFHADAYDNRFEDVDEAILEGHIALLAEDGYIVPDHSASSFIEHPNVSRIPDQWHLSNKGHNTVEAIRMKLSTGSTGALKTIW